MTTDLDQRTEDAIEQLRRYSGRVFNEEMANALAALACLNDDLWHDRHPGVIAISANLVRMHLDRIVKGARDGNQG